MQLTILPSEKGLAPDRWRAGTYQMTTDNGRRWSYHGMLDEPTPVVWTEWISSFRAATGFVLRQEAFAHMVGEGEIKSGTEPLFAWIRMSIREVNPLMSPDPCDIIFRINKPHLFPEMYLGRHCALRRTDALYPRKLSLELSEDKTGGLLIEEGDKVRLGVLPGQATRIYLEQPEGDEQDTRFHVVLPVEKGAYVDVLLPMIPESRELFQQEMELGRDVALARCNDYWSKRPATAATVDTPEKLVNDLILRNIQYGELIAQRMPGTDYITNLTGSMQYARMWATPTTMFDTMLLDTLGHFDAVGTYLEIFREHQGTVKPPGPSYDLHPGYLAGPEFIGTVNWLSDHGAILNAAAYHALISNDQKFVDRWLEPIVKAYEFTRDVRRRTNHEGIVGILPPAVATDQFVPTQATWNIGWHYRALATSLKLLERLNHPKAEAFAAEVEDYRETFIPAFREATRKMPTWTDDTGSVHHVIPTSLSAGGDITHGFYLDTGPMFLVYAGLLDATDPLMKSSVKFFREGPNWKTFDPYGTFEQPPVLIHELSSCEPPWSWNMFHSHQLGDRYRWLEAMYSLITGAHCRQTFVVCESRGGITGIAGHTTIYAVKLSVIDDFLEDDALHLLRLTPKAWLKSDYLTRFDNMPTIYGPVTLRFQLSEDGSTLDVAYNTDFHHPPKKVVMHTPPILGLNRIVINGKAHNVKPGDQIELSKGK